MDIVSCYTLVARDGKMCIMIASVDLKLLLLLVAIMSVLKEVCSACPTQVQRTRVHQAKLRKSLGLAVKTGWISWEEQWSSIWYRQKVLRNKMQECEDSRIEQQPKTGGDIL